MQRGEGAALALGRRPVAGRSWYFSESRYSSLPGAQRGVLAQLVAGVDAPGRRERRGEHRPHLEGGAAAVLEVGVQDVGGVDEEVGPHVGGRVTGQLREVLGQLLLGVAPGEVGVRLLEADLGQGVHHRRPGERLGQEDHVGVGAVDLGDHPLPEHHRLGVRVVHPEDPHPVLHPVPQHPQRLGDQAVHVLVEGDRVDVLVLLRRVLRVGDRAVGAVVEPLGVLLHPGVVGGALQREVQRHLHAQLGGPPHEPVEVVQACPDPGGPRRGRPRASRSPTARRHRPGRRRGCCCGPCGRSCRWGGSAAGRPRRSPSRRSRAAARRPCGRCRAAARGVPSDRGKNSYQEPNSARSRSTSSGSGRDAVTSSRSGCRPSTASTSGVSAAASRAATGASRRAGLRRGEQHRRGRPFGHAGRRPLVQLGALLQDQFRVDARRDLDAARVAPGGHRVAPGLHPVRPVAHGVRA